MATVLTKTTKDGRQVSLESTDGYRVAVVLAGTTVATGDICKARVKGYDKAQWIAAEKVLLTAAEYATCDTAMRTLRHPAPRTRESLADEYAGWMDEWDTRRQRHIESDGLSGSQAAIREAEEKAEAAREALAAYDAAHPEETAARKAEREESRRRFLAAD